MISGCSQKLNLFSADEDLSPWRICKEMCFLMQFLKERKEKEGRKEREEEGEGETEAERLGERAVLGE